MRDLQDHILHLEGLIEHLRGQLADPNSAVAERQRFQSRLQVAELALSHCRAALALEKQLPD